MIYYWGCWDRPGHYMWAPGRRFWEDECLKRGIPTPKQLDATSLFLPDPECVGTGALTYLPARGVNVLAWWGSPFDQRGKVNSAIIQVAARNTDDHLWALFHKEFPSLAAKLERPVVVRGTVNA